MRTSLFCAVLMLCICLVSVHADNFIQRLRAGVVPAASVGTELRAFMAANLGDDTTCGYTTDDGKTVYDFSSMKGQTYDVTDPDELDFFKFSLTMCGVNEVCKATDGAFCRLNINDKTSISLASFTAAPAPVYSLAQPGRPGSGVLITFNNGDKCPSGFTDTDTIVRLYLTCGRTVSVSVNQSDGCEYEAEFKTPAACHAAPVRPDGDDGISGGAIVLILVMSAVLVYIVAGCIINYFVRGQRGLKVFPNGDFWVSFPGLVRDGFIFTWGKLRNLCGAQTITTQSGDYNNMATN